MLHAVSFIILVYQKSKFQKTSCCYLIIFVIQTLLIYINQDGIMSTYQEINIIENEDTQSNYYKCFER